MTMPTAKQHLATCAKYLGIRGKYNIFNRWYWCSLYGYQADPGSAWCAAYQSYCANDSKLDCKYSASASAFGTQFPRVDKFAVQPGDVVVYNWDGRSDLGWCDHVGIVEWSDINGTGYFGAIEGNTGNAPGGEVARMTRGIRNGYFTAFFRPTYKPEQQKKELSDLQLVLNEGGKVYRLRHGEKYNWTASDAEKAQNEADGYVTEGVAFVAPKGGTIAIYRLRNDETGDHLLTTSLKEAQDAVAKDGYVYEGVPFFGLESGGVAYIRFYNKWTGIHLYVREDSNELANLRKKAKDGWNEEGECFRMAA